MNETTPTPLPPPPVPSGSAPNVETGAGAAGTLSHPIALFVAAAAAGLAAAIVIGGLIGVTTGAIAADGCSPSDGWCGLGALLIGMFAGIVTGGIAYLVSGITVIWRCRPSGRRAANVIAHVLAPPVTLATLGFLSELASSLP